MKKTRKESEKKETYKINLHILEPCNYSCKHCFSVFKSNKILELEEWKAVVDNCIHGADVSEFNIAGGEPLLYPKLSELIQYIANKGYPVSIITNGSLITDEFLKENAPYLKMIGFSIDSFCPNTLRKMGRMDCHGTILSKEQFKAICEKIKEYNPLIKIKVNTVVARHNYMESLADELKDFPIDRWKVLKMKVFQTDTFNNIEESITLAQFHQFLHINREIEHIIVEESMKNSYIIIDSNAQLIENSNDCHTVVSDVLTEDFALALKRLPFDRELYQARYAKE